MVNSSDDSKNKTEDLKDQFLYPLGGYHGEFTPENLAFNANLQEFAQRIGMICALETGGKLSQKEAYDQIKALWKQLKRSKRNLLDESESSSSG
ncbi:MAG: hypothetical protein F6K19_09975 [Cyanothece sp. SIO1E1]|nr:hypothetical protein [Cyanothece sp. SIO1E1]